MARIAKNCFLQCVKETSKKINLPHNKTVYLGRNEETTITDTALSRKQVAATADYNNYCVAIEILGVNYSGCNGYALRKGGTYQLKHGDRLELRIGAHEYDVLFDTDMDSEKGVAEPERKRQKLNYSIFNTTNSNSDSLDNKALGAVNSKNNLTKNKEACKVWESIDNGELLIYTFLHVKSQRKIAAFDLDGTVIKTKSGARFAKNSEDWILNFPEITKKFTDLHDQNYKIVIFTNQGGIKSDPTRTNEFKSKVEAVFERIKIPIQLFAATGKTIYRKPAPGMWNALCDEKNDAVEIDIANSFYVGDAAGREKNWAPKKSKDHSISDRLFAINLGLKFYTPEEYFLGARSVPYVMPKFDPRTLAVSGSKPSISNKGCEVIVMVGSPGAGKSHFCKEHLIKHGYVHANRDTLGSWQACVKLLETSMQRKQNVVIDNTNGDKTTRKRYIDVAKKFGVPCRCFLMTAEWPQCKHNNRFRDLTDKTHAPVGEVIINMYKKNFEEPQLGEGFKEIVKVDFIPKFHNVEHEKLYKMFLMES